MAAPREVVLTAQRDGRGDLLKFKLPVEELPFRSEGPHLIHTLAARRIIQELTDGQQQQIYDTAKTTIIQLGVQYQLASPHTSFVAIDNTGSQLPEQLEILDRPSSPNFDPTIEDYDNASDVSGGTSAEMADVQPRGFGSVFVPSAASPPYGAGPGPPVLKATGVRPRAQTELPVVHCAMGESIPGAAPVTAFSPPFTAADAGSPITMFPGALVHDPYERDEITSQVPYFPPQAQSPVVPTPDHSDKPKKTKSGINILKAFTPPSFLSLSLKKRNSLQTNMSVPRSPTSPISPTRPPPPDITVSFTQDYDAPPDMGQLLPSPRDADRDVVELVRLQSFNGSFVPSKHLEAFVGSAALAKAKTLDVDGTVWATILAVAYLKKYLADQPELLDGLLEKAMDFVAEFPDVDFDALLANAQALIQ